MTDNTSRMTTFCVVAGKFVAPDYPGTVVKEYSRTELLEASVC
jgi:hypothetical protein